MTTIKQTLMERDEISSSAAEELIRDAVSELRYYISKGDPHMAEEVCLEFFGLECEYAQELLELAI